VLQIHIDLDDAATTSGADRTSSFLRVVLPLIAPMDVLHLVVSAAFHVAMRRCQLAA
jgi:ABC-type maltose transport system permease subunit